MKVPFSDISFDQEELDAVSEVLKSGWPSRGKVSDEFESQLGKYLGSNVALVNSGSSALLCALLANDVKPGRTVFVSDFTFVATASIPAILGAKIVPVDCDLETFNVTPPLVRNNDEFLIRTDVAGLPTGFFGETDVIEDAAEALGASTTWRNKIGAGNHLTCFSFNATKSLSTVEGGAVASKNEELIEKVRSVSNYGRTKEQYVHDRLGMNMRITDMQSALGLISLKKLDKNLARRKEIADRYRKELQQFRFQKIPSYVTKAANYWMIGLVELPSRMLLDLREADIDARPPFTPIHLQPCFPELKEASCPNSVRVWMNAVCLPIFNGMSDAQVEYVIEIANISSSQETSNYKWQFARQAREKLERSSTV